MWLQFVAFCLLRPFSEGVGGDAKLFGGKAYGDSFGSPLPVKFFKCLGRVFAWAPEFYAAYFGGMDSFRLALAVEFAFKLCEVGGELEDEIGDEGAGQVAGGARVQQGRVEDDDGNPFFGGERAPGFKDVHIASSEAVDAFDDERVVCAEDTHELFPCGAVEVFAGLLVEVEAVFRHAEFPHGDALAVFVLLPRGNADVSVCFLFHDNIPPVSVVTGLWKSIKTSNEKF